MSDNVVIEQFVFMSPVITERADGSSATIRGVTLHGPVTRNKNYYTPEIKTIIANGLIGKPFVFGYQTDHINPEDFPGHDIVSFLASFKVIAAKYTVGHISEAWYDFKADLIRYKAEIRNTVDNPDVVERAAAKDLVFTSIGGVGRRVVVNHPLHGMVKQVMTCETTHMAFVAIPGDASSQINSVVIQESFDLKDLDVDIITEQLTPEQIKKMQDDLKKAEDDKKVLSEKLKAESDARKALEQSSPKDVQTLLDELKQIQEEKDRISKQLKLTEDEKKELENSSKAGPTREQLDALESKVSDVETLRSEIKQYKEDKLRDAEIRKSALLADVIELVGYKDAAEKADKTKQFGAFTEEVLRAMKLETETKRKEYDDQMAALRRQQSSRGSIRLENDYEPENSLRNQYKELNTREKDRLWEIWVNDTLSKMVKR